MDTINDKYKCDKIVRENPIAFTCILYIYLIVENKRLLVFIIFKDTDTHVYQIHTHIYIRNYRIFAFIFSFLSCQLVYIWLSIRNFHYGLCIEWYLFSGILTVFMLCVFNCVKRWLIEKSQVHENMFLFYVRGSMYLCEQHVYIINDRKLIYL